MRRVEYSRYGGPEELHLVDVAAGRPERSEIRVRVRAASVNPVDWKIRAGTLKIMTGRKFPRGMGQDYAGIVEAVGSEVRRFKIGDEVFGAMEPKNAASFAETVVTPERTAATKPAVLSFEQAASLPTVAQIAWLALVETGQLQAGQRVFVNGCLGSVGRCAVQIGRLRGAQVSGACGQAGFEDATAIGVANPIDSRRLDPRQLQGRFDVILDTAGTMSAGQCSRMLRGKGIALHINPTIGKMLSVTLSRRNKLVFLNTSPDLLSKVAELAAAGSLTLPISKTVQLSDAIPAITELEQKGSPKGKVVVVPA